MAKANKLPMLQHAIDIATNAPVPLDLDAVLAIAVETSADRKLTSDWRHRRISVTHVTQGSCPETCAFMDRKVFLQLTGVDDPGKLGGCYGNTGHEAIVAKRLNAAFSGQSPEDIARFEAHAIRTTLSGRYPLRMGIIGEVKTVAAAEIRAEVAAEYTAIADQPVYGYGHAIVPNRIPRAAFGCISILASCDSESDVAAATAMGYACAVVMPHADITPATRVAGLRVVKCPQQIGAKLDCLDCGICMHDEKIVGKCVVAFDGHGDKGDELNDFMRRALNMAAGRAPDVDAS